MTKPVSRDAAQGNNWVTCDECGNPIEFHDRHGYRNVDGEQICTIGWYKSQIRRVRIQEGLSPDWRDTGPGPTTF